MASGSFCQTTWKCHQQLVIYRGTCGNWYLFTWELVLKVVVFCLLVGLLCVFCLFVCFSSWVWRTIGAVSQGIPVFPQSPRREDAPLLEHWSILPALLPSPLLQHKNRFWWNKTFMSTVHYICLYASVDQYQVSLMDESLFPITISYLAKLSPQKLLSSFLLCFFHPPPQTWEAHVQQLRKAVPSRVEARNIKSNYWCLLGFWGNKEPVPPFSVSSRYSQVCLPV